VGWNRAKAIAHLRNAGAWRTTSAGNCAMFTREAIEAGFEGQCIAMPRPPARDGKRLAKDYGPGLLALGFLPLPGMCGGFHAGDVVIIDGFEGDEAGHMAMYDGTRWISDFAQNNYIGREGGVYPGKGYQKHRPLYHFYRHMGD
jgi:hypothetical protein